MKTWSQLAFDVVTHTDDVIEGVLFRLKTPPRLVCIRLVAPLGKPRNQTATMSLLDFASKEGNYTRVRSVCVLIQKSA